uniref:NET domain-containing protein n=1 Tax=Panagrellus redivivus TaxID=6233 RepID=A0A7E4VR09_PANRE
MQHRRTRLSPQGFPKFRDLCTKSSSLGMVQKVGHNPFDDKEASSGSGPLNLNFQSGRRHRQRRHLTFLQFEEMKRLALESLNLEEVIEEVLLPCLPRGEGLPDGMQSFDGDDTSFVLIECRGNREALDKRFMTLKQKQGV